MPVRNLDAIIRNGNMVEQEKENRRRAVRAEYDRRLDAIYSLKPKAIDMIDTINAMINHSLGSRVDAWLKGKPIRYFNGTFSIGSSDMGEVTYQPLKDNIHFYWNNYGMVEGYNTNGCNAEYTFKQVCYNGSDRTYDKNLTSLSLALEPYIDGFFAWVDQLS